MEIVNIHTQSLSITMAANFQSLISSALSASSLILCVIKRNSFKIARSSFFTFSTPPSSIRIDLRGGKSFSGMALSTSLTLEIKLTDGGVRFSSSRILCFLRRNCRERSFPGRDILKTHANHSHIRRRIWNTQNNKTSILTYYEYIVWYKILFHVFIYMLIWLQFI